MRCMCSGSSDACPYVHASNADLAWFLMCCLSEHTVGQVGHGEVAMHASCNVLSWWPARARSKRCEGLFMGYMRVHRARSPASPRFAVTQFRVIRTYWAGKRRNKRARCYSTCAAALFTSPNHHFQPKEACTLKKTADPAQFMHAQRTRPPTTGFPVPSLPSLHARTGCP